MNSGMFYSSTNNAISFGIAVWSYICYIHPWPYIDSIWHCKTNECQVIAARSKDRCSSSIQSFCHIYESATICVMTGLNEEHRCIPRKYTADNHQKWSKDYSILHDRIRQSEDSSTEACLHERENRCVYSTFFESFLYKPHRRSQLYFFQTHCFTVYRHPPAASSCF